MKNMSPSVTRPTTIVTKTVSTDLRKGMPMPGNDGPNCQVKASGNNGGISGIPDNVTRPTRTIYESGF